MTEKKGRGSRRSDQPGPAVGTELKEKRDAFLQTFFRRGAELTDELVRENRRLSEQLARYEEENAALKTQLASDRAIRDLLQKIEYLEREKARLLSTVHEQEEITSRVTNRFTEVESELENFANLYVASFQLHASLRTRAVVKNVKETLVQLVGARSVAIYFSDDEGRRLAPILAEGVDLATLPVIAVHETSSAEGSAQVIERTFLTGVPHVAEGEVTAPPAACIPLQLDDRVVGAIVVYALLEHKRRFITVDRELFKLLGAHAGGVLVAAHLWAATDGRLPSIEALRAMCA
ncbi:MAG TPA: GAF domain-containing protein [Polyangiaceae bacterium]|nr:GAF domain-containing protein [Polyangiaceae bacterium]